MLEFIFCFFFRLLIPFKRAPNRNSTDWEKLDFIVDELAKNSKRNFSVADL